MEPIIHGLLLALHNIALVGCAAAPFYNRNLVNSRGQYGPKLSFKLDKVVEDTIQGNKPFCIFFIITLLVTGMAMPLNHYLFHGAFNEMHTVSAIAMFVKLVFVFGMIVIMGIIFLKINPELSKIFVGFSDDNNPDPKAEAGFFKLRARRKYLCEICLVFALMILISSAFLGFSVL